MIQGEISLLGDFRYLFSPLPEEYRVIPEDERRERTWRAKRRLGKSTLILAHNYQSDEIVQFADFTGDSYQLSRRAAEDKESTYIVFCGVSFMAETADIVSGGKKIVILPSMEASCPMAGMAEMVQVQKHWGDLADLVGEDSLLPITYINTYADLKAFTGKKGGAICTSSNAEAVFRWALKKNRRIFFFPDYHLGENIGRKVGIPREQMVIWNPWEGKYGGLSPDVVQKAFLYLWMGFCQVHDRFRVEHIAQVKEKYPNIKILVHPECIPEVVEKADEVGSTSRIIEIVEKSPPGTQWAIGTEYHLVNRLKNQHPEQFIIPLGCEVCIDCNAMRQIDPNYLLWILEELGEGRVHNRIQVDEETAEWARVALDKMLRIY